MVERSAVGCKFESYLASQKEIKMEIEKIAEVCHRVNNAYCIAIGDPINKAWGLAKEEIRQSAIDGVKKHLENENMTPEESHNAWLEFKKNNGWVYGKEKDIEKKTHPLIVPYSELSDKQKAKDYIFKEIVSALKNI